MFKIKTKYTKPNMDVPWMDNLTAEVVGHLLKVYINPKLILGSTCVVDGLNLQTLTLFVDEDTCLSYIDDPALKVWRSLRDQYKKDHNIVTVYTSCPMPDNDYDYLYNVGKYGSYDTNNNRIVTLNFLANQP